jgi:hypothetical protein
MVNEAPISPRKRVGFSKIFGKFFGESVGPTVIERDPLPISIKFLSRSLKAVDGGQIALSQSITIERTLGGDADLAGAHKSFLISPELFVVIDDGSKGDPVGLSVTFPKEKKVKDRRDGSFLLDLEPGEQLRIDVRSEAYDHRWSTDLRLQVEEASE